MGVAGLPTGRGLLLDLDGTLLDHRRAADKAVATWARSVGASECDDLTAVRRWADLEREHFRRFEQGELSFQEQRRARVRGFSVSLASASDAEADALFATYLRLYEGGWRALPGAAELIGRAHAESWRVAVLTNGDEAQQRRKLSVIGLDNRCLRVFASSTLGFAKPAAQAFWAACEGLGRSPSECVMVGDDYANDVQAARAAGLTAIHVTRSPDERRPESAASLLDVRDRLFAPSRPPA